MKVVDGSIAQTAGLQPEDIIAAIAGERVSSVDDIVSAVARQAPGTWLPISIRRAEQALDIVARFPPRPQP
jgi:S1-C subfamily serine protease